MSKSEVKKDLEQVLKIAHPAFDQSSRRWLFYKR